MFPGLPNIYHHIQQTINCPPPLNAPIGNYLQIPITPTESPMHSNAPRGLIPLVPASAPPPTFLRPPAPLSRSYRQTQIDTLLQGALGHRSTIDPRVCMPCPVTTNNSYNDSYNTQQTNPKDLLPQNPMPSIHEILPQLIQLGAAINIDTANLTRVGHDHGSMLFTAVALTNLIPLLRQISSCELDGFTFGNVYGYVKTNQKSTQGMRRSENLETIKPFVSEPMCINRPIVGGQAQATVVETKQYSSNIETKQYRQGKTRSSKHKMRGEKVNK